MADLLTHPVTITKPRDLAPLSVGLRDAARLLGVSQSWLHTRAKAGQIPSAMLGGRRLFVIESLRTWLAEQEVANATQNAQKGHGGLYATTVSKAVKASGRHEFSENLEGV